jgi:hypothetical protein
LLGSTEINASCSRLDLFDLDVFVQTGAGSLFNDDLRTGSNGERLIFSNKNRTKSAVTSGTNDIGGRLASRKRSSGQPATRARMANQVVGLLRLVRARSRV